MSNIRAMPEDLETRTVMTPRTGTKICILVGLAFIVAAVYFYFVPATSVHTDSGSVFGCGTAANPSNSTFAKGTCWRVTDVEKYRAIAAAAIGILTIVLGAVMFGVDRRTETRRARHEGYADDRPRSADRDDRGWDDEPRRRQDDDRPDRVEHADDGADRAGFGAAAQDESDHLESRRERRRPRRDWDDDRA
ncbi:hypothetical protein GCM10011492_25130 [Flexivirga endophytica]|uniref:Transmembrane protein n=2 Tax=Flexivirga endophytica TaxID=1849103 RepID=A0A916T7U1_9MICO|nr:hypothetical protein GCM10011492_25130 [Flexivirga endophytica]GHB41498.1 hypothetical protein GCM10008112_07520 [Flexivirga endophytica]